MRKTYKSSLNNVLLQIMEFGSSKPLKERNKLPNGVIFICFKPISVRTLYALSRTEYM